MLKKKIAVIGCGWMGLPLCEYLSTHGYEIITTTTDPKKAAELNKKFKTFCFSIPSTENPKANIPNELLKADAIIYTVPPLGKGEVEHFFSNIPSEKNIIFISSTSVYGKNQGDVTEESAFDPASQNALVLKESEAFLKKNFKHVSIVRPGGLYGEDRHPVHFLAGKSGLKSGDEYLHLVHLDDCVQALAKILEKNLIGEDFNLMNDMRVKKSVYYTELALKLGLPLPQFDVNPISHPTKISNEKSKKMLGQEYRN